MTSAEELLEMPDIPKTLPTLLLSGREYQVFILYGKGLRPREIAKSLFISPKTVDSHLSRIRNKLGVERNFHVLLKAIKEVERCQNLR